MAVITRLLISGKNGTDDYLSYPIAKSAPILISYQLADIREPQNRKSSRSLTIEIYGTNEINKLFENIFSFNVATQYFNKNLKTPVKYIVDEIENFRGDLQLMKVVIKPDNNIIYECSIIGEGGSLFNDIGEKFITGNTDSADDLDFSAYDHTYDRATQISTRSNLGTGLGVLYPFIDKGSNGGSDTVWNVEDFLPTFSAYEYFKKIVENTGRTFTSSLVSATKFKKTVVYPNLQSLSLSSAQLSNRQFYVGLTSDVVLSGAITYINNTRETVPFFDVGAQVAGINATINDSGKYNVVSSQKIKVNIAHTDGTVTYAIPDINASLVGNIWKSTDSGATFSNAANVFNRFFFLVNTNKYLIGNTTVNNEVSTGEINLNSGDILKHENRFDFGTGWKYYNASNVQVMTGTGTVTVSLLSGNTGTAFYCLATAKEVVAGNTLEVNNALPLKIKQKDLLKSLFLKYNLFVDIDPADSNNLIIEDYNEFYDGDIINYENRTDLDKDQSINPNLLEGKRYIYRDKPDADHWNTIYQNKYNEPFGTETIITENDFKKDDKITETIFSPTPNVANYGLGIAHPRIYQLSGLTKEPITPNIRLLYVGGVKQTSSPITWKDSTTTDLTTSDYLYAGHTDDWQVPTLDLNFGTPKEVFYTFIGAYFTDNNLYNLHHKNYLANLIDRDSKFVIKYLWLSPKDIYSFSFRNRLFIDGAYYIVNKIENYEATKEDSTLCELIKLIDSPVFTPTQVLISSDPSISAGVDNPSARLNSGLNVGTNIQNKGTNSIAFGDNIVIPESCSNVTVIGNNVILDESTSDLAIINGSIIPTITAPYSVIKTVTANYNAKYYDGVIFADATSGIITIDLSILSLSFIKNDISIMGISASITKTMTIKKIDSSINSVIIDGSGALIDGSATYTIYTQYDSVTLQWDGTNWNII